MHKKISRKDEIPEHHSKQQQVQIKYWINWYLIQLIILRLSWCGVHTHFIDPAWSERVRTHCHVSVAHTFMELSQDPEMSQSPRLTRALTASWCPLSRVDRVKEQDCLRGLLRVDSTPDRPAALLTNHHYLEKGTYWWFWDMYIQNTEINYRFSYHSAWCSNASRRRLILSAPTISGWPLMTSLRRQLSIIGKRTSLRRDRQIISCFAGSATQCSSHLAAASKSSASSQSIMSSEPRTTLKWHKNSERENVVGSYECLGTFNS